MPELPEVETVRRGLAELLPGRTVGSVEVFDSPKSFPNSPADVDQFLIGSRVIGVRRRAKVLIVDLDSGYSLVAHLKMTGQMVFRAGFEGGVSSFEVGSRVSPSFASSPPKSSETASRRVPVEYASAETRAADVSEDLVASGSTEPGPKLEVRGSSGISGKNLGRKPGPGLFSRDVRGPSASGGDFGGGHPTDSLIGDLPDRSTRVQFRFTDGSKLFFNDQRKFGWVKLLPTLEVPNMPFMQKVGPEPLEKSTTSKEFIQRIRRRNGTMIKPAILDQTVIAGVGNIYADEALWAAKIHPETRVRDVSDEQLNTLFNEIVDVLTLSIEKGGSTDRNYVDAEGKKGSYLSFAKVFRREGQACHRHLDQEIVKLKVAGRGTHICPVCQVGRSA